MAQPTTSSSCSCLGPPSWSLVYLALLAVAQLLHPHISTVHAFLAPVPSLPSSTPCREPPSTIMTAKGRAPGRPYPAATDKVLWLAEYTDEANPEAEIKLPEALHIGWPQQYPTMSAARRVIRKGQVFVNGKARGCGDHVISGDRIELRELETFQKVDSEGNPRAKKLKVVYEDDHMAVVIKPAGVAVHGTGHYSLVDRYMEHLTPTTITDDALTKPTHAHRLDAPVGGLLIVAKTKSALRNFTYSFENKLIRKRYRAILLGKLEGSGSVTEPVEEREARTDYRVIANTPSATYGFLTAVDLEPVTGRKHQLRRHMAFLGTPILGDIRYGPDGQLRTRGLFLLAQQLWVPHPITGKEMHFSLDEPEIFGNTVAMERNKLENQGEEGERQDDEGPEGVVDEDEGGGKGR